MIYKDLKLQTSVYNYVQVVECVLSTSYKMHTHTWMSGHLLMINSCVWIVIWSCILQLDFTPLMQDKSSISISMGTPFFQCWCYFCYCCCFSCCNCRGLLFFFFLNVDKLVGWFMVVIVFNKIIAKVKILTLWTTHLIWENSVNWPWSFLYYLVIGQFAGI